MLVVAPGDTFRVEVKVGSLEATDLLGKALDDVTSFFGAHLLRINPPRARGGRLASRSEQVSAFG